MSQDNLPGLGEARGPQMWAQTPPNQNTPPGPAQQAPPLWGHAPEPVRAPFPAPLSAAAPPSAPRRRARGLPVVLAALVMGGLGGAGTATLLDTQSPVSNIVQHQGSNGSQVPATDAEAAAQRMLRSVVQVRTSSGSGSGFVIDDQGHVMTNHHVISGSRTVRLVLPDGSTVSGRVIGSNRSSDIAVIQADGLRLPAAELGTSGDLRIGEPVIAVGSPLGLNGTVTSGIVSAVDRQSPRSSQSLVQTDASINPGNSGGPLVNMDGQVVGVNTSIATMGQGSGNIGIGFAVPIDEAANIARGIIT